MFLRIKAGSQSPPTSSKQDSRGCSRPLRGRSGLKEPTYISLILGSLVSFFPFFQPFDAICDRRADNLPGIEAGFDR